jgi:glycosyltransferase involved in cell wall biosynthesis
LKVAIVHDWLVGGGAEKVVYELHKMYPDAPVYTSYCSPEWRQKLSGTKVITSYMQRWPRLRKFLPPLRALWFSRLDLSGYDLVISSSGAEAKGVKVKAPAVHINYCHAPTHYYWSRYDEYMAHPGFGRLDWLARFGLKLLLGPMRRWDYKAAQRPHYMIANSHFIKSEIKKYYGRNADVIHPPVDVDRFKILNPDRKLLNKLSNSNGASKSNPGRVGFLIAGRQTPYKRFDLAVQACTKLGAALTVVGDGPDHKRLVRMAGPSVNFTGRLDDKQLAERFRSAEAFIFPGIDDFGITPVEAMAAGTPVIAYKGGGALDYVQPGVTGEFFTEPTAESLEKTLSGFKPGAYDSAKIQKAAAAFAPEVFVRKMSEFISSHGPDPKTPTAG